MFGLHRTLIKWISSFLSHRSIAIRVDGYLFNPHSINSGVSQGSVISPVLFILFINDLLSSTSSSIFSFADDTYLSSSFSSNPQHLAYTNISPYRNTSASLLTNDFIKGDESRRLRNESTHLRIRHIMQHFLENSEKKIFTCYRYLRAFGRSEIVIVYQRT